MKKEELLDAIGNIRSETVERNSWKSQESRAKKRLPWRRWVAAAAVAVMAGAGLVSYRHFLPREDGAVQEWEGDGQPPYSREALFGGDWEKPEEKAPFVEVSTLLANSGSGDTMEELALRMVQVNLGQYGAQYEEVAASSSEALEKAKGEALEEEEDWYRLSGHEDLQYLIHASEQGYTLWKFGWFLSEEYPYRDVLRYIYGVDSGEDIQEILLTAANMDNSDAGKRLQEEIGEYGITDQEALKQLYDILCSMTCYGQNRWDLIDYGGNDESMVESVRAGRYLAIETDDGIIIDSLKYTAVSGMFYEYCGVAYSRLSPEEKETVDRLFRIEVLEEGERIGAAAGADSLREYGSVEDLLQDSWAVVKGRVLEADSGNVRSYIYTTYQVEVLEVLYGSMEEGVIAVNLPGGVLTGEKAREMAAEVTEGKDAGDFRDIGNASAGGNTDRLLAVGDEAYLFLVPESDDAFGAVGGYRGEALLEDGNVLLHSSIAGFGEGIPVEGFQGGRMPESDFLEAILSFT